MPDSQYILDQEKLDSIEPGAVRTPLQTQTLGVFSGSNLFTSSSALLAGSTSFSVLVGLTVLRRPSSGLRRLMGNTTGSGDGWSIRMDGPTFQAEVGGAATSGNAIASPAQSPTSLISLIIGFAYNESFAGNGDVMVMCSGQEVGVNSNLTFAAPSVDVGLGSDASGTFPMTLGYIWGAAYHTSNLSVADFEKHAQKCFDASAFADADGFNFDHLWLPSDSGNLIDVGAVGGADFTQVGTVARTPRVLRWW